MNQLDAFSASLAAELATQLEAPSTIFARYGLDKKEAAALMTNPQFLQMVRVAKEEWGSIKNTKERVRIKARLALEEGLVSLYRVLTDETVPAPARVSAARELKDIADVGASSAEREGSGMTLTPITIVLGGPETVSVDRARGNRPPTIDLDAEGA